VSPQLQQVLNEARQLPPQDLLMLVNQLSGEVNRTRTINEAQDDRPEAELEYVNGVLVVKSQQPGTLDLDLVEFIREQREERNRQVGGW
jgi:7,8-dihydro-6-hydroxymethylpterin-pyrophosphokinase